MGASNRSSISPQEPSIRLDIWLWRARFIKTRSGATKLIKSGKLRHSRHGQTRRLTKAHFALLPGDRLTFTREQQLFHIEVFDIGTRRGPAPEAQALYHILEAEP